MPQHYPVMNNDSKSPRPNEIQKPTKSNQTSIKNQNPKNLKEIEKGDLIIGKSTLMNKVEDFVLEKQAKKLSIKVVVKRNKMQDQEVKEMLEGLNLLFKTHNSSFEPAVLLLYVSHIWYG